ncbi:MAG: hypothetical protein FJ304_11305 [Planctomycetes bacterium]|nr:hypothetical protein [Planctomycetota bacterium]
MIDGGTKEPIRVRDQDKDYLYLVVSVGEITRVRSVLESQGLRFWVSHPQISIGGGPYTSWVNVKRETNASQVQTILNSVA